MMRGVLIRLMTVGLLGLQAGVSWAATNDPLLGYWRTIDDET